MYGKLWTTLAVLLIPLSAPIAAESICYGSKQQGRLENAVQLPANGKNFRAYSSLGHSLGRTYAHSRVAAAIVEAYAQLELSRPEVTFIYGETGWREGGRIKPHRTHQNGLSVDFMVPVRDLAGEPAILPTELSNKFGYGLEFDETGRLGKQVIDFEAIAEHLYALHQIARKQGLSIERVIFEPAFLQALYTTKRGAFLRNNLRFVTGKVWIRHDEHYHVDFMYPCRPLKK